MEPSRAQRHFRLPPPATATGHSGPRGQAPTNPPSRGRAPNESFPDAAPWFLPQPCTAIDIGPSLSTLHLNTRSTPSPLISGASSPATVVKPVRPSKTPPPPPPPSSLFPRVKCPATAAPAASPVRMCKLKRPLPDMASNVRLGVATLNVTNGVGESERHVSDDMVMARAAVP
ncbi:hypothetical protein XA68_13151 [Ophiocordyceps unilateralis]|uniref:Uncharacterized protein n=1 Tax=Ophiocordyceps unilateralis TaxID=268505 RepID=A0A2A9PBE8_OPHUN|nr:hypothetical protein XA68_13151 [Ophiocordyceps unilateralis]